MKFIHTADLHLGKIFHDHSLIEDQAVMLEDLAQLLEDGGYSALLIAGDIYDRSIPSPEAVELFGSFLERVKSFRPSPELLVIPGNHDSASRLGFGKELFARLGIRFGVSAEDCDKPVIVEKNGEKAAFFLLPFLNPGALSIADNGAPVPIRSQSALAEEAARRMEKSRAGLAAKQGVNYSVLAAHLFASGGKEAGSERVFLGSAELVNTGLFKNFDYVGLWHLHRCQSAGDKMWYPGSPLAYSFGEVSAQKAGPQTGIPQMGREEKFFLSVELDKDGTKVEKIPVKPRRKVTSISGPFARFTGDTMDRELLDASNDYLEIRLTDSKITENARDILRRRFPFLLSLRQDEALAGLSSAIRAQAPEGYREECRAGSPAERRSISGDFRNFLVSLYGEALPQRGGAEKLELFNTLLCEVEEEESVS